LEAALSVSMLAAALPGARFLYVYRDPRPSVVAMVEAWRSGRYVTRAELPGWEGPWSLPLVPGWSDLAGSEPVEVCAAQWAAITEALLEDLGPLEPERFGVADAAELQANPRREVTRLAEFLGLEWEPALAEGISGFATLAPPDVGGRSMPGLRAALPRTRAAAERACALIARPIGAPRFGPSPSMESPLRSVHTPSFAELLATLGSSILVSTYQTGKLICLREQDGLVNTHFRDFERPMGIAVHDGRLAIATRTAIWDYRNVPATAVQLEPEGGYDACFVPRNVHYTGDVAIHEIAVAEEELWLVATGFSCLATVDAGHSFVPRWRPPFVTALANEDRCHLNGFAIRDGRITHATALGATDSAGGWRTQKARGGVIIDVATGEIVADRLSMPHSPRWHGGALWVLESGEGGLCTVDLSTGALEPVARLPGFTRGLAFAGRHAFVGLSRVRETATFGGLPLTTRLSERLCGVWVLDTESGEVVALLRFEELVQEIFDVALLPGARFPEIAQEGSDPASYSYVLPAAG
jgi:uncharacterized protein (TIGR03032 family)